MKSKPWNTIKLAAIGAIVGVLYVWWKTKLPWSTPDLIYYNGGRLLGGLIGGAILFAAVSAVRNLFARK